MKKRFALLVLFIFNLTAISFAQVNLNEPLPADPNVRIGKLPNGLTYYIRKNTKPEKKVELRLAINAGSILERDDQQGLAHFLEHMAFNGTKNFPKNELVSYLQSIGVSFGADLNAYTSFDETVYILPIPTDKPELLDKGFQVLEDWASAITLDKAEIDKERGVVLEELRIGKGAEQRMRDRYLPLLFYGSQYTKRLPIGQKQILENFDRQAIVDFYEDWYRPDLMAVVAVGDLDVDATEAKIKAHFAGIKAKRAAKPRLTFEIPDHKESFTAIETDKEASLTFVQMIYKKPAVKVKTKADLRRETVKNFFGGMLSARLDEIRQSPNPPFIFAGMNFGALLRNKGSFTMFGVTTPENVKPTLNTMLLENRRVKEFGFTETELKRQKEDYLKSLENRYNERAKTESGNWAMQYVGSFLNENVSPGIEFEYEFGKAIIPTITLAEVNALAKETTSEENRVAIVTGLDKEGIKYPTKEEISAQMKDAEVAKLEPYKETVTSEPLVGELPATAKIVEEKKNEKFGITYWTLSNGVKVVLKPTDFKADEIIMNAFSPGGLSLVGNEKVLSANYAGGLIDQSGVKRLSRVELTKMLAGTRFGVAVGINEMFENVTGNSTPQDFEKMLQLVYLKFTDVNFQKPVFDSVVAQQKMFLPSLVSNPQTFFSAEISKFINQKNPRYINPFDTTTFDKINFEDIKAIYAERFSDASDFTFVFIGAFDSEKIKPQILKYLGNLPALNRKESGKDLGYRPVTGKVEKVIKKGVDQKSVVEISFSGETKFSRDENSSLSALGELLTIKLIEILREEKSGVYGVGAFGGMSKLPYENYYFLIGFPCGPENVDALTKAALDEVKKIQNGQVDEKDVAKVREAQLVRNREAYKQNAHWSSLIYGELANGIGMLDQTEAEAEINAITKTDIQKVAQKYLKIDERQQFVLMPEGK
jgi:zinc protease